MLLTLDTMWSLRSWPKLAIQWASAFGVLLRANCLFSVLEKCTKVQVLVVAACNCQAGYSLHRCTAHPILCCDARLLQGRTAWELNAMEDASESLAQSLMPSKRKTAALRNIYIILNPPGKASSRCCI
jgi:hypothetical protein